MVSLVSRVGLVVELMVSIMAIAVAEFLEKSPKKRFNSVVELSKAEEEVKEPEVVEGVKVRC